MYRVRLWGDVMADYKEMYLELSRKVEQAIRLLIEAQQRCEEMYISVVDSGIDISGDNKPGGGGSAGKSNIVRNNVGKDNVGKNNILEFDLSKRKGTDRE